MGNRKKLVWIGTLAFCVIGAAVFFFFRGKGTEEKRYEEVRPRRGTIRSAVSTTGAVEPQNRLKIQSSVGGRIEEILVEEGKYVNKGEVLAMLSSTERAALLDAAKLQGKSEQGYWQKVYKETAVIAPMTGQVIVRSVDPGQTVTTSDSLFVISDRLIVKAYVDETDIGKVKIGQKAEIGLDAYPDIRVNGVVGHIYYESHLQNNVNIYYVDIIPESVPDVFRSGMSANIDIMIERRENVLLLPVGAVQGRNGGSVVMLKGMRSDQPPVFRKVTTGMQDDRNIEILEGIAESAVVLMPDTSFVLPSKNGGSNPFMPKRPPAQRR
ncbi:MAG: efflux RND transporter periplasmic adaptor subunit [Chlorobiaceae bacterium]|nr:efflux RND transporter periplasmic adaptor subunit [Chlorobiaceae bacterium]NTV60978.1 efflux RND transporter periplasmic adaptor subunit [Chlorobiaceae bacterium]